MNTKAMSIKQIAVLTGMSTATVSRVLNHKGNYTRETEEKVMEAVRKYEYVPNVFAKGLKTNVSSIIGVVVPYINCDFFSEIVMRIQHKLYERGYSLIIYNTNRDRALEVQYLQDVQAHRLAGLINLSGNTLLSENDPSIPVVFLDAKPEKAEQFIKTVENSAMVIGNNEEGGYLATKSLLRAGCKKVMIITNYMLRSTHQERLDGFCRALGEEGYRVRPEMFYYLDPLSKEDSFEKVIAWAKRFEIDGMFLTSDVITQGVVRAALHNGIQIPQELRLIGYDVNPIFDYVMPPVSTVQQDSQQMVDLGVQLLLDMIEEKPCVQRVYQLPNRILERG